MWDKFKYVIKWKKWQQGGAKIVMRRWCQIIKMGI